MPHNRTRLWVGLAIVAVTIPAVGTYYIDSSSGGLKGTPIVAAGSADAQDRFEARNAALHGVARDYEAEVAKALGHTSSAVRTNEPTVGSDDDPNFDVNPLDDVDATDAPTVASAPPEPAADFAPPVTGSLTRLGDVSSSSDQTGDAIVTSVTAANGNLSDNDVYRIVTTNLSPDDRDEFVRSYAAMTIQQRSDLLDSFRVQMQNGNGQ